MRTSDSHKLLGGRGDELLLEETGAAALDEVELLVHLVGAIKGYVERHGPAVDDGPLVEVVHAEAGRADEALGLAAGGDKSHAAVKRRALGLDGVNDVDDGAAGANADILVRRQEVVLDGLVGRGLLGGLDEGGCVGGHVARLRWGRGWRG